MKLELRGATNGYIDMSVPVHQEKLKIKVLGFLANYLPCLFACYDYQFTSRSTRGSFCPQWPAGQTVVTGVVASPPPVYMIGCAFVFTTQRVPCPGATRGGYLWYVSPCRTHGCIRIRTWMSGGTAAVVCSVGLGRGEEIVSIDLGSRKQ